MGGIWGVFITQPFLTRFFRPIFWDQTRNMLVVLNTTQVGVQLRRNHDVVVLVVKIEETTHVYRIEPCVTKDTLSDCDVPVGGHHPMVRREEGRESQGWHVRVGAMQWQP